MKLYEIASEYREAFSLLEETEGELTTEIQELLDEVNQNFEAKAKAIGCEIRNLEAGAQACKDEIDRLMEIKKSHETAAKSLKEYLLYNMAATECKKVETDLFTFTRANTAGSVIIDDIGLIPEDYKRCDLKIPFSECPKELLDTALIVPDKTALARAIKNNGGNFPGARLIPGECLRIR